MARIRPGSPLDPPPDSTARPRRGRPRRRLATAIATLLAAICASAAQAQLDYSDPGERTADTEQTPVAKDSERWQWYAGAEHSPGGPKLEDLPQSSITPIELDFFDVAFPEGDPVTGEGDLDNGLAGGAECRDPVADGASPEETREHLASCERVPVVYRYAVDDLEQGSWAEAYRSPEPGFVGSIAWLGEGRALIVGGNGTYPRREKQPSTPENDPAGEGRAWLYEDGSFSELEVPAQMRGLTALASSPRASDCPGAERECALAGGFRQLWTFSDGAFRSVVTEQSPDAELDRSYLFLFRVRAIDFRPSDQSGDQPLKAVAATAGCCAEDALRNGPRLIIYDGQQWYLRQRAASPGNASTTFNAQAETPGPRPFDEAWQRAVTGSWAGCAATCGSAVSNYENFRRLLERGCIGQFTVDSALGGGTGRLRQGRLRERLLGRRGAADRSAGARARPLADGGAPGGGPRQPRRRADRSARCGALRAA